LRGTFYGSPVAVKITRRQLEGDAVSRLPELANELRMERRARHSNFVQCLGADVVAETDRLGLVLERVDAPDLVSLIAVRRGGGGGSSGGGTSLQQQRGIISGMASALWFLQPRCPVIVREDVKSGKVLAELRRAKLLDFGLSRLVTRQAEPIGGTQRWMATAAHQRASEARLGQAGTLYAFQGGLLWHQLDLSILSCVAASFHVGLLHSCQQ